jgi:aryl sulfotransferase
MIGPPVVYRCGLTDSTRWDGFEHRPGDIVVSVPTKCGTTWAQMICALLVFGTPDLPAPLTSLSPWLDMRLRPAEEVYRTLDAQPHRRFLKTHTPLDGLPLRDDVTYLVLGRDPRDVAVSMHHHRQNFDRDVIERLLNPLGAAAGSTTLRQTHDERQDVLDWLFSTETPAQNLSTLRGTVWHVTTAWDLRHRPNVVLLHYADLIADLAGGMRYVADRLSIDEPAGGWGPLVDAATFERMRERSAALVPDERLGLLSDNARFFREGRNRQWEALLDEGDLRRYESLLGELAPADLRTWLHHGAGSAGTAI